MYVYIRDVGVTSISSDAHAVCIFFTSFEADDNGIIKL